MKKKSDWKSCSDLEEVKSKSSRERFIYWILNRERIRIIKNSSAPPWTIDPILSTYRFCNVIRIEDKVSQWLYERWYKPYYSHPNMVYAVALARFINKPASLQLLTELVFQASSPKWESIKSRLRRHRDAGNVVFNAAYMVRGNDGVDKIECVVDHYVKPLKNSLQEIHLDTSSMENTWNVIHACYGFGSFMAGQVVADLRWAIYGLWLDRFTWAPVGPGSIRGIRRYYENPEIREADFLEHLKVVIQECTPIIRANMPELVNRMEAHDWQNCFCEFDKYERVLWGEGKPKQLYRTEQ